MTYKISKNSETTRTSVYDFLYHDSRRVASYLSQFDNNGLLTGLTQSKETSKGSRRGKRIGLGGNTPLGGGNIELEIGPTEAGSDSLVRVYDPYWANALQFLDVLRERRMIQPELEDASIGQFVSITGFLSIHDFGMMKEAWKLLSVQRMIKAGTGVEKRSAHMTAAQKAATKEQDQNTQLFLDMIQIMPHSVHARMISQNDRSPELAWCALNQENLVTAPSDIALTYGQHMAGQWSIIGVLSAHPEYVAPELNGRFDENDLGLTESIVGQVSKMLVPLVRMALGRPSGAYAVTPLLIFREVS